MSNDKLGFTFYPKDWWTSETYFELDSFERYVYLECIFIMYSNDGFLKTQKLQMENRIRTQISDEAWQKITQKFILTDLGYTHKSVNKRLRKAVTNRVNGQKGGRPPKPKEPSLETQNNPPLERERESEGEYKENRIEGEGEKEIKTDDANPNLLEFDLPKIPDEEKEKSCVKKENRNDGYAEILKSPESESWLETVAMQNRKQPDEILKKVDDFVVFLLTVDKEHSSKRDFLEHFINWLKKNIDKPAKQNYPGGQATPKFSINQ